MFDVSKLINIIKEFHKGGDREFIIYPFGHNGRIVKNVLEECFGITPTIIDNEWSNYNDEIFSIDELIEIYNGQVVILTIEDNSINEKMYKELRAVVRKEKIININSCKEHVPAPVRIYNLKLDDFKVENIIPTNKKKNKNKLSNENLKVRFLNFSITSWNSVYTICQAFKELENVDILIVSTASVLESSNMQLLYEREKYKYCVVDEYNAEIDKPDIFIINHPCDKVSEIKGLRENCKMVIAASTMLIRFFEWKDFWDVLDNGFGRFYPDYYLFDSLLYKDIVKNGFGSDSFLEIGNAKYDGIYNSIKEKSIPKGWEKIIGKKVIVWTTDHGIYNSGISRDITFDIYAKTLFAFAEDNDEVAVIVRLHDTFVKELKNYGVWSRADLDEIIRYCENSKNLVWDNNLTYNTAFGIADCVITDAYCGITCSALSTMKPMCLLYRKTTDKPLYEEYDRCYYSAHNPEELKTFLNDFLCGEDSKKESRQQFFSYAINSFDGKNGKRIRNLILEKYKEKYVY